MKNPRSVTESDRYVGDRIRAQRVMLKMTQADLGDALGVSFQQIQKYERGVNRVSSSRLQGLARALKTDVSFLLSESPNAEVNEAITKSMALLATSEGSRLVAAFSKIKESQCRTAVVKLLEAMS